MRRWLAGAALLFAPATALAAEEHGFSFFMRLPGGKDYYYVYATVFVAALLAVGSYLAVGRRKPEEMVIPEPRLTLRNF
ncbi:MAG: hypothetical protein ACM319_08175, partial [Deltaproteobacteria bacterium]|nr:hypothetical protein [Candidatus Deferrimicrobiaceae bacterium]